MNRNISFVRKVVYVALIALLLFPLFYLGQPATRNSKGGLLADIRTSQGLTQAGLGEIDPASETMKLSTLGLRPVAVALLWNQANNYKMKEDWDHFSASLNQIARLQPNFIKVWDFQAHNVSYNVSVEFDNYKHRYHWVKKGFYFLMEGARYNQNNPLLLQRLGWFYGQKIGRADEHKQFRRLFRVDTDFHDRIRVDLPELNEGLADGPDGRPDNWLVGRLWNVRAQEAVDLKGKPLVGASPLIFYSYAAMMRINFAKTIEEEGYLDEQAEVNWKKAGAEWRAYGERDIPSSWGHNVRLGSVDRLKAEIVELQKKLDELVPGAREKLIEGRRAALPLELRSALDLPANVRSPEQHAKAFEATQKIQVSHDEVLAQVSADKKEAARRARFRLAETEAVLSHTEGYRSTVNYGYWDTRCEVEQLRETVSARKHIFTAEALLANADLEGARKSFELAWDLWAGVLEKYPILIEDITGEDLYSSVEKYEKMLGQLDQTFPKDFKLKRLRDYHFVKKSGGTPTPNPPPTTNDSASPKPEEQKPESETKAEKKTTLEAKPESKPDSTSAPKPESKPASDSAPASDAKQT